MRGILAITLAFTLIAAPVAGQESENTLTHGMVQMTLRVGQTTQADVLETFGAPNITTIDATGSEMWVYHRHATVTRDSSGGFSIGLGLAGGDGGGLLGIGKKKSKSETTQRTMTLIIKFNDSAVVSDFRSRSSSF